MNSINGGHFVRISVVYKSSSVKTVACGQILFLAFRQIRKKAPYYFIGQFKFFLNVPTLSLI